MIFDDLEDDDAVLHLFTAAEAERVFGIKATVIRTWAQRKQIWARGLDERNRPMYDKRDLLRLRDRGPRLAESDKPR